MAKKKTKLSELKDLIKKNPVSRDIPDEAKAIVMYKAIELQDRGVFHPIDIDLLVMYALNIQMLKQIDLEIARDGHTMTLVDRYGNTRLAPHPGIKTRKDLVAEIRRIGKLFGFTPLDSQSIQAKPNTLALWERLMRGEDDEDDATD